MAKLYGGGIIGLILIGVLYPMWTIHQVTITPEELFIDPAGREGSYYLVRGDNGKIIELDKPWWNWSDNVDIIYFDIKKEVEKNLPKHERTFECFGWEVIGWHWYSTCYKILKSTEVEN
jgi:hypothetical protein